MNVPKQFDWKPQQETAAWTQACLDSLVEQSPYLAAFSDRLLNETGNRLIDWVEHIALSSHELRGPVLGQLGFQQRDGAWVHSQAILPVIYEVNRGARIALRVESVDEFVQQHGGDVPSQVEGWAGDVRRALVGSGQIEVWVVQRCGQRRWDPKPLADDVVQAIRHHRQQFSERTRRFEALEEGFAATGKLIDRAVEDLGQHRACHVFFETEREYWQSRNRAAQIQKQRQDALGLGWANHDHHTYRSGRRAFPHLVRMLEKLGMKCRERFYAGREAGWGAQVLENRRARIVVFADVDLAPEEVAEDFAHQPLAERDERGTVGLWCELHGEAFFEAGMHHLECQFAFDEVTRQLKDAGIDSMPPFTDLPHLRQAFTVGETWNVEPARLDAVTAKGWVDGTQAEQLRSRGAIGSHLEVLQRDGGYKGFNQTGISEIIRDTDPRRMPQ